jgi:1,4-dihydroxy-6-naphthoate synthase
MRYDRILPAVAAGRVDAGLIIHESRFTYPEHGLVERLDLGAWWEAETGAPIPLGGIAVRRELPARRVARIAEAVAASVRAAWDDPAASTDYVARHAQEMSAEVRRRHIETYVNDFSLDVGAEGRAAVRTLFERAVARGLLPAVPERPFWEGG